MKIRVSYGTAVVLGLKKGKMLAKPTTAYFMTYYEGRCLNNCAFCVQARKSKSNLEKLSRITWPAFDLKEVLERLKTSKFARICLQTVDYPNLREDVLEILRAFYPLGFPISLSITPVDKRSLKEFRRLGVDYIGVGIDAASERVYNQVKDSMYSWEEMWKFVDTVVDVFGEGKAFVHLIFGLGESEEELLRAVQRVYDSKAKVSIFAFTPVKGTRLENKAPPDLNRYRLMQIGVYLIENKIARVEEFKFDNGRLVDFGLSREELLEVLDESAFMTHGCPGCNRPYYNEKPSKEPYNFPVRPEKKQFERVLSRLFHE
ncbi:MAG: radical SAM protein [Thermotogae bacterium]|uniref:Radical SAM protein n=1 Tax=Thermococcus litoralis TaxID=2265 RepID=A0A7C5JYN3_THELI|nr:MAG: radical SAM protein [Thermotogota bacterium]HHI00261.1 radical SAM protein [Thermococcus litoralis]